MSSDRAAICGYWSLIRVGMTFMVGIMAIVVGIDEAGYGPILGPLVVSASVFEAPDACLTRSMWDLLRRSVCKKLAGSSGRIAINDSKKLHTKRGDNDALQRGVLAGVAAVGAGALPETVGPLLAALDCGGTEGEARFYPWYRGAVADWPLRYDRDDILTSSQALVQDMAGQEMGLLGLWCRPMLAGRFNLMVEGAKNKATVLFAQVSGLIHQAFERYGAQERNLQILVDRLGGRSHYRSQLQRLYPEMAMKILKEEGMVSSYQLRGGGRQMKIHFLAKGDDRHLPVALASMVSKTVRELFMEMLNAYFSGLCPEVAGTAGYYQDGRRFLAEIGAVLDPGLMPKELLVRQR